MINCVSPLVNIAPTCTQPLEQRHDLQVESHAHLCALPLALVVVDLSDQLTMLEWNSQAEIIFGYQQAEIVGKSPYDLIIPSSQREQLQNLVGEVIAARGPIRIMLCNVTKDRRRICCEWILSAIPDPTGRIVRIMAVVQDITQRLIAEERASLWSAVLEQTSEGIMVCGPRLRILAVNAAFETITGFCERDAVGKSPRLLHSGRQNRAYYAKMWQSINAHGEWSGEIWNRRKNGEEYVQWLTVIAVRNQSDLITHYVGTFTDITQRKRAEARARYLSLHDALTDLPNSLLVTQRLKAFIEAARRSREKIAVLCIDLDRFKNINDSMGRRAGDILLQMVAQRISAAVRHTDFVARLTADEFFVVLPALLDPNDAAGIAQKVLDAIHQPMQLAGQELIVSASVGICIFPDDGADADALVGNATAAMDRAKRDGRDAFQFYRREINELAAESLRTETALRLAIERNELVLHYQPQVDLSSGAIVGAEALVRWNRPGIGLVPPAEFIPMAEERGLIISLGRWVVAEACRQIHEWDVHGATPIVVAINISASEFHQAGFVDHLASEMQRHTVAPARLELELTESIAVTNVSATVETLQRLHRMGIRLALDDFGTGYSSLSYLSRFPVDRIKIDQSFVREMTARPEAMQIVRAIIALARSFAMKVIAEGVETAEQATALQAEHCDELQGYLASVPLPAEQFAELLATGDPIALDQVPPRLCLIQHQSSEHTS